MTSLDSLAKAHFVCNQNTTCMGVKELQQGLKLVSLKQSLRCFKRRDSVIVRVVDFVCRVNKHKLVTIAENSLTYTFKRILNIKNSVKILFKTCL